VFTAGSYFGRSSHYATLMGEEEEEKVKADILCEILDLEQLGITVREFGLLLSGFSDTDPVFALHFMNVLVDVE